MKKIIEPVKKCASTLYLIISEPGDATRYDYFAYWDGYDDFSFMPRKNLFKYPQKLNYWAVQDLKDEDLFSLAKECGCNPNTLRECIDTIAKIKGDIK